MPKRWHEQEQIFLLVLMPDSGQGANNQDGRMEAFSDNANVGEEGPTRQRQHLDGSDACSLDALGV